MISMIKFGCLKTQSLNLYNVENIRIIPRLDIKGPNVVKGIHIEGLRIVGNPKKLALKYYQDGADELLCLDIVASLYGRSFDFNLLRSMAEGIFIPITVGGGIKSVNDINNALRAGADKVAINTYATKNSQFLSEAVQKFGSQCVTLLVEAKKRNDGTWEAYTDGGREHTGMNAIEWIKKALSLGVGEVIITSIDRDGSRKGYDLELICEITKFAEVPIVANSGAGTIESVSEVIDEANPDAIAMASALHYNDFTIKSLKKFLYKEGYNVRI